MTTAIAHIPEKQIQHRSAGELTVQDIVDRKRKILEVMKSVMVEGEHYGKIPGCGDKPTLFKAGAEVLATTFGLAPKFIIEQTELPGGHREIRITCQLVSIGSGVVIGEGVGSCSTMESKYRWRQGQRKCPSCGSTALLKSKKDPEWFCWSKKGGCGDTFALDDKAITEQQTDRVENPDAADVWNTVLKMAKKRAQVDATLTAVGASDLLTQDIEDLPPASRGFDRRERESVDDAEVVDVSGGNGETERGSPTAHEHDPLDAIALTLIADIDAAMTVRAVKDLAPRFAALPKGTRQRASASSAYYARIELLEKQGDL